MMSQLNLEDIYTELNNLLQDVCSFLTNEAQNGTLSAKAKNEAEKLVSRSRKQVQIVTQLSVLQENAHSNYPYLEMLPGGSTGDSISEYVIADYYEPQHYEESYPPEDIEPISSPSSTTTANEECLYADSPQYKIEEKSVKYGPLCRKERYLFIEQKKQYMAGLVGYWLLLYGLNKKDQKPIQIINLLNYSAKSLEQRKEPTFEIHAENEKRYEFIARSTKDMEQWVWAINCKKHICTNANGRNLPEIPRVTVTQECDTSDSNQNKSDSQKMMHCGSDEDIYASVEDFSKLDQPQSLPTPVTEEFPKVPPRAIKEVSSYPKIVKSDNTYNNLQTTETVANEDTNSEYDIVQCSDTQKQTNNEEKLEIYDELKITETVNINVRKPSFSNTNTTHDNYDSVDTGQELEDYDTLKPSKIPIKINPPKDNAQVDEEMVDYDELKPICRPDNLKHASSKTQLQKDEELENYDELKPIPCKSNQPTKVTPEKSSEEVLEDYDVLKPIPRNNPMRSLTPEDEKIEDYEVHLPESNQNKLLNNAVTTTPSEDKELVYYDDLKTNDLSAGQKKLETNNKLSNETKSCQETQNNGDKKSVKVPKPVKKFWEKRVLESPKKETDTSEEDEPKRSVASLKSKFNVQSSTSQEKNKPLITSSKPKTQTLLNKFPSFSKNKSSKDESGNSKVQYIRQQLEYTLSFKSNQ